MRSQKKLLEQEEQKESGVDTPDTALNLREPETRARPAKDSVDDQIDALILRYETSSIREKASVNESLSKLNLRFLLEQEEEEEEQAGEEETDVAAPGAEAAAGEEGQEPTKDEEPSGSDDMQVTEPAEDQEVPNLDVDKFTMRVVRLVNNYQNLLRTEEAIINRAKTFLDERNCKMTP